MIALDQRHLRDGKSHGQRDHAKGLERDPDIGALGAPNHLVQHCHGEEEQGPARGENAPAARRQIEHLVEHDGDEGAAEQKAAAEHGGKQAIDDGRLDLDEGLVMQHQGQRAEHQHDDTGDQRHDGHVPRHRIGCHHRRDDRDHESGGRDEQMEFCVDNKEHQERAELGRELEQRVRLSLVHVMPSVAAERCLFESAAILKPRHKPTGCPHARGMTREI